MRGLTELKKQCLKEGLDEYNVVYTNNEINLETTIYELINRQLLYHNSFKDMYLTTELGKLALRICDL